jgi:hypothetical protein
MNIEHISITSVALFLLADGLVIHYTDKSIIERLIGRRAANPRKLSGFVYLLIGGLLLVTTCWT